MTRFADNPTVEVSTVVAAGAAELWPLVSDVGLPARFSPEFLGASWVDGATGPALGARFTGRNRHPRRGEWETTSQVVACDPARTFAWAVGDPANPSAEWRFELDEAEAGGTRLRYSARMGPGPSGVTRFIEANPDAEEHIVSARLAEWEANMTATVDGIKALAESGAAGRP